MKLSVSGYKSLSKKATIDVNGLTILSGANSSGKSSFMQPFLLIKQTLDATYSNDALILHGDNVKLSDSKDVLSRIDGIDNSFFTLAIQDDDDVIVGLRFDHEKNVGLLTKTAFLEKKRNRRIELVEGAEIDSKIDLDKYAKRRGGPSFKVFEKHFSNLRSTYEKCLSIDDFNLLVKIHSKDEDGDDELSFLADLNSDFQDVCKGIIHIPGIRGSYDRTYKVATTGKSNSNVFKGTFEQYVASIIHSWKKNKNKESKDNVSALVEYLSRLNLTSNIDVERKNDTQLEVKVSRFKKKQAEKNDFVNILDVGFGVSQILPVLVALLSAKKNNIVYVEQPELHLHPNAQMILAEIIAYSVNNGVKFVIETHSSIFIRGIQTQVAKGLLNKSKVSLNWFTQDELTGETNVSQSSLDSLGAFGDWPEDFETTYYKADVDYLDAVEKAEARLLNGK
ncbi:AAA family ATPase [Pectobacterium carotovorum]|uniref:AAA family ATPase n=1 Tax=Pectobacterium carotovorum TaxID=554 RepID=UPI0015DE71DD|nr:AAA family ATPase [Pectobacterium carotovorum]MBA0180357.1 AAA family ATPase [Pectobacterium carotovorum]MCA6974447.1 AAA family ATPase [Pectobacterium carotovorum]